MKLTKSFLIVIFLFFLSNCSQKNSVDNQSIISKNTQKKIVLREFSRDQILKTLQEKVKNQQPLFVHILCHSVIINIRGL